MWFGRKKGGFHPANTVELENNIVEARSKSFGEKSDVNLKKTNFLNWMMSSMDRNRQYVGKNVENVIVSRPVPFPCRHGRVDDE